MLMPPSRKLTRPGQAPYRMKDDEDLMRPEGQEMAPVVPATNTRVQAAQDAARRPSAQATNTAPSSNPNPTASGRSGAMAAPPVSGNPRFDAASGVVGSTPPPSPAPPAATSGNVWDPLLNNEPNINISEEQAAIEQLLQGEIGRGSRGLLSQFAAGGGGRSGALLAAQEQMRLNAARQAAGQISDARQRAEDDWRQNLIAGNTMDNQDRQLDAAEEAALRAAEAEQAMSNPNFTDNNQDGRDDFTGNSLEQSQQSDFLRSGRSEGIYWNPFVAAGSKDNPFRLDRSEAGQLAGLQQVGTDGFGQVIYYDPQSKSYYAVHN